jgi:hypothetical protein
MNTVEIVVPDSKHRQCVAVEKSKICSSVANGSHPRQTKAAESWLSDVSDSPTMSALPPKADIGERDGHVR